MNTRLFYYLFFLIGLLFCFSCSEHKDSGNSPETVIKQAYNYFEIGKQEEDEREKIKNFNKALQALKFKNDTIVPKILDYKIYYHSKLKEYDSTIYFSDSLIRSSSRLKDSVFLAKGFYRKAFTFRQLLENEQFFENSFRAKQIYLEIGDSANAGKRLSEMATAQSQMTDYIGSQETATEALELLPESDSSYVSNSLNVIATAYRRQGLYQEAIVEWQNALKYATSTAESLSNLNNIALSLQDEKKYQEAIAIFENILERSNQTSINSQARFLDNLAFTKWLKDSSAKVEKDLLKAAAIRKEVNDQNGLLASYDHLSQYYRSKAKNLSRTYADSLLLTARKVHSKNSELNAIQKLIDLSSSDQAKELSLKFISLNDSIRNENIRAKNLFAKIKYDENQKQKKITDLQQETVKQKLEKQQLKNQTIILSLVGLLLIVSGGFAYFYIKQKYKREKIREAHKTETRISKRIHDELANDIYNLMSGMQAFAPADIMDKLENIYKRTRNISRENSSIPLNSNYIHHLLSTLSSISSRKTRLIVRGEESIKWAQITSEKKIIIYRVLQELMINMNKHSGASLVAIIFAEEKNFLSIQYSDNGIGMQDENLNSGNGIHNMKNRLASINGSIHFEPEVNKGLKVSIRVAI